MNQPELQAREQALFTYVDKQAENLSSQSVDPATHALNQAYAAELHHNEEFFANFSLMLETRPDISPANIGRRGFKAVVAVAMAELMDDGAQPVDQSLLSAMSRAKQDQFAVLAERTRPEDWQPTFKAITDHSHLSERFPVSLHLPITSDVSERSKLLKAVVKLHHGETIQPLRVASLGASLNHNLKRLDLESHDRLFAYNRTLAMQRVQTEQGASYVERPDDTRLLKNLIYGSGLLLRESVGVDLLDFDNRMFTSWALSNSRYLGELKNTRLAKQFSALLNYRPEHLSMVVEDVATMQPDTIGEPADVAYAGFMFYQLDSQAEVERGLANAEACTTDEGLVIIQDFCDLDANGNPVFFKDDWPNWVCSVLVKDKKRPDLGWQKYMSVKNGRTTEVVIEDAARQAPRASQYGLDSAA